MDLEKHRKAFAIFRRAMEQPLAGRSTFVEDACGADADLLEHVRQILADDIGEGILSGSSGAVTTSIPDTSLTGRQVGRYHILSRIGAGGMGVVWKAEDPLLKRMVAIKFLPPHMADSADARRRLMREATSASNLNHPGIATVYDAGEFEGQVYIAFRFVEGITLRQVMRQGPVSPAEAVRITIEAGEAIEYAHSQGTLHRDISSNNIMLTESGDVVVVDFGLARPSGTARITRTGAALGTLAYMAPEVFTGEESDHRADVYALGVVLYELLTGSVPFQGDRVEALVYATVNTDPDPPHERVAGVPRELSDIILSALAKKPDDRYGSARELTDNLQLLSKNVMLPGHSGEIKKSESYTGIAARRRKRRFLTWATVAVGVALVVAAAARFGVPGNSSNDVYYKSVAVIPFEMTGPDVADNSWLAYGITRELTSRLANVLDDVRVVSFDAAKIVAEEQLRPRELAKALGVDAIITGTIHIGGGRLRGSVALIDASSEVQEWSTKFDEPAGNLFQVQQHIAIETASRLAGELSVEAEGTLAMPAANSVAAYELYLKGSEAMQLEDEQERETALAYFERALTLDPELAPAHVGIGAVQSNRYYFGWNGGWRNLELAEQHFLYALELEPGNTNAIRGMVRVFWEQGRSEDVLKMTSGIATDGNMDVRELVTKAESYLLAGLPEKSIPILTRVTELEPTNSAAHWWRAMAFAWNAQWEEARIASDLYFTRFGDDAELHVWLGISLFMLDRPSTARLHFRRAIKLYGNTIQPDSFVWAMLALAELNQSEMQEMCDQIIPYLEDQIERYPDNVRTRNRLAASYGVCGNESGFIQQFALLASSEYSGVMSGVLAILMAKIGKVEVAAEMLEKTVVHGDNMGVIIQFAIGLTRAEKAMSEPRIQRALASMDELRKDLAARY